MSLTNELVKIYSDCSDQVNLKADILQEATTRDSAEYNAGYVAGMFCTLRFLYKVLEVKAND